MIIWWYNSNLGFQEKTLDSDSLLFDDIPYTFLHFKDRELISTFVTYCIILFEKNEDNY